MREKILEETFILKNKHGIQVPPQLCPAFPKLHPFTNQANTSSSYFSDTGKALLQLPPSHTPLLSNPDSTQ